MLEAGGLLCVHAHPDDESIATGGVLARAVSEGRRATVVTCTGGERGEIVGAGLDPDEVRPRLAELRRAELERALEILGTDPPRWLGYRDSGMAGTDGNDDPGSFWRADFDQAVGRLVTEIRSLRPAVVVTYDAFGGYGHPDHVQAHRVASVAVEAAAAGGLYATAGAPWRVSKLYYATLPRGLVGELDRELAARGLATPFSDGEGEEIPFGLPDEDITTVVDVRPWLERKRAALAAHHSQLGPESFFLNVPDDLVETVFGREWFALARSAVPAAPPEEDLFAGLPRPSA